MEETKFTIDVSQALAALDAIDRGLGELEATAKKTQEVTKKVFTPGGDLARRELAALDQAQREYQELETAVARLRTAKERAFDPRAIVTYSKAIDQAEAEMRNLERAAGSVGIDLKKALEPPKAESFGAAIFGQLKTAAISAAAGISFGAAITEGIRLNAEYERVRTSLTTILKDVEKADRLLAKLNQFAAETPFGTEQINQAATALLAFGESETTVVDRLREIGTISAATGKDFNELATIYGKARVAGVLYAEDINQLVEAGVPIIQEFAKQLGVSEAEVKKLASQGKIGFGQLQTAFTNLTGEGGRFAGLLEAQGQTITGLASTFRDNLSVALRETFAPLIPVLKDAIRFATDLLGVTKTQSQALEEERVAFLATANQINLTNTSTETRTKLINTLKQQYPQFLGQINAEKVTNEQLKPILDKINQSYIIRIALQKQQENLAPLLEEQAEKENTLAASRVKYNQLLIQGAEAAGVNLAAIKDEQAQREAVLSALRKSAQFQVGLGFERPLNLQAQLLTQINAQLSQIDASSIRQTAAANRVSAAESQRLAIVEQLKKTYGEVFDIATGTPEPGTVPAAPTATGGKKGKTAAEIAFENREKDLAKRQLLLNDLQDGLDKELATIALHFDRLRLEYERAGLDISKLAEKQSEAEVEAISKFLFAQVEADAEALEGSKRAAQAALDGQRESFEAQKATRDAEIDLREERGKQLVAIAKKTGAEEKQVAELSRQFDLATQKARLESELQFQEQLLAITGAGNEAQAQQIAATIAKIKAQLATIDIEASIAPDGGSAPKSIWDVLGIDTSTEDGEAFARQVEEMAGRVVAAFQDMAAQRVELAQAEVDASDERLSRLENELDQEIRLAELGFASDVTLKRKQIEEEKKKNAAVKAELEKARKSQVAIDTAIQASSLITAIANLFKSLSSLPFGAGIPIAIALSGLMIGFFIKSKIDAAKAAKARYGATGFLDGQGIVHGRYHTHGGERLEVERGEMVQVGDDGSRRRVEVVRRERVTEYMDLLRAANSGDRREIALQALRLADIETLPDWAIGHLLRGADIAQAFGSGPEVRRKKTANLVFGKDTGSVSVRIEGGDNKRTNQLLEAVLAELTRQGKREYWSPDGKVKITGNIKTKYIG